MSTETCNLCHKDCTPWAHINGHICQDCYMKPAWIKCSDKMPEKWERILLYSPYEKKAVIGALTNNGWGLDTTYISDHGHSGYLGGRVISSFTNWMPLPSPPDIVNET